MVAPVGAITPSAFCGSIDWAASCRGRYGACVTFATAVRPTELPRSKECVERAERALPRQSRVPKANRERGKGVKGGAFALLPLFSLSLARLARLPLP